MIAFNREYIKSASEIRLSEKETILPKVVGNTLLGWDSYQKGNVGVIFATLLALPFRKRRGEWDCTVYKNNDEAFELYKSQLDSYKNLMRNNKDRLLTYTGESYIIYIRRLTSKHYRIQCLIFLYKFKYYS